MLAGHPKGAAVREFNDIKPDINMRLELILKRDIVLNSNLSQGMRSINLTGLFFKSRTGIKSRVRRADQC
jgi:hypothetical protein